MVYLHYICRRGLDSDLVEVNNRMDRDNVQKKSKEG